ncbi:MAG: hypothetical protein RR277_05000 [Rikenellaceae bacterium]
MEALKPKVIIMYEGKDVSGDFRPIIKDITFRDYLDGKASEISMSLSNKFGYFFGDWYPQIDDRIDVMMGYEGSGLLDAGTFFVDETDMYGSRSGDDFSLRAMSIQSSALNSASHKICYSNKPIADIATTIADSLGCSITGELSGTFSGVQTETNLAFLNRIAKEHGRILKIDNGAIILYPINDLGSNSLLTIKKQDTLNYRISDVAAGRISRVMVKWWDRDKKKMIEGEYDVKVKGGGSIVVWQEIASSEDATERARDMLAERNKGGLSFEIEMLGDTRLRAGVSIEASGFGRFDTTYYISEACHQITNNAGYITRITLNKNR